MCPSSDDIGKYSKTELLAEGKKLNDAISGLLGDDVLQPEAFPDGFSGFAEAAAGKEIATKLLVSAAIKVLNEMKSRELEAEGCFEQSVLKFLEEKQPPSEEKGVVLPFVPPTKKL